MRDTEIQALKLIFVENPDTDVFFSETTVAEHCYMTIRYGCFCGRI